MAAVLLRQRPHHRLVPLSWSRQQPRWLQQRRKGRERRQQRRRLLRHRQLRRQSRSSSRRSRRTRQPQSYSRSSPLALRVCNSRVQRWLVRHWNLGSLLPQLLRAAAQAVAAAAAAAAAATYLPSLLALWAVLLQPLQQLRPRHCWCSGGGGSAQLRRRLRRR